VQASHGDYIFRNSMDLQLDIKRDAHPHTLRSSFVGPMGEDRSTVECMHPRYTSAAEQDYRLSRDESMLLGSHSGDDALTGASWRCWFSAVSTT
jgi:hypothetical protein